MLKCSKINSKRFGLLHSSLLSGNRQVILLPRQYQIRHNTDFPSPSNRPSRRQYNPEIIPKSFLPKESNDDTFQNNSKYKPRTREKSNKDFSRSLSRPLRREPISRKPKPKQESNPVDFLNSPQANSFISASQSILTEIQKKDSAIKKLVESEPSSHERKNAIDLLIKQILYSVNVCIQGNQDRVLKLFQINSSNSKLDLGEIFKEFSNDVHATEKTYLEYDNDMIAFETYVKNPPLVPILGRLYAVCENEIFSSKESSIATKTEELEVASQGVRLFATSFLRYCQAKIRGSLEFSKSDKAISLNMTNPGEWYPSARSIRRNVILHIGPTNSGKTYSALQALKNSKSGYYAGPLRLLAREVYNRFKSEGQKCNLVTGEEVIEDYDDFGLPVKLSSGTIEMVDITRPLDVAVIDEIQMIEDDFRGWAWTRAFLGVRAKEVHLCGDPSSEMIIRNLVARTGDNLVVKRYERLSPLVVEREPLQTNLKNLKEGDCIVAFSKRELLDWKSQVEKSKKSYCAIIYGALPPESRSKQAELFNETENGYNYLVASDAVGMGLNLSIRRIIFLTTSKFNGKSKQRISISQIKQIAGRAGRFRVAPSSSNSSNNDSETQTASETGGRVTALSSSDLRYIDRCLKETTPRIVKGGLFPSETLFRHYAIPLYSTRSFDRILEQLEMSNEMGSHHFLCGVNHMIELSRLFGGISGLTLNEKLVLSKAPVKVKIDMCVNAFKRFCVVISKSESVTLLDIPEVPLMALDQSRKFDVKDIDTFESIHNCIGIYLWLSYRFPMNFTDREGAFELKGLCEKLIDKALVDTRDKRLNRWSRKIARDETKLRAKNLNDDEDFDDMNDVPITLENSPSLARI